MNRGECYSHWPNVPILGVKTRLMTMHKKIAIIDIVSIMAINLEGVDTLDAPPTREPDLGHKKKSRLARLLRPLSKLFPYQFRML